MQRPMQHTPESKRFNSIKMLYAQNTFYSFKPFSVKVIYGYCIFGLTVKVILMPFKPTLVTIWVDNTVLVSWFYLENIFVFVLQNTGAVVVYLVTVATKLRPLM